MDTNENPTIAAVATPPGEGGIAIIRISGKEALSIADKVFSGSVKKYKSHTAHYGKILDGDEVVDEVLLLPMLAPNSFTGEDIVEIHCHGGTLITRKVLELVLKAGAKAAGPGEFSQRAFLNGKLDLAQAEAIQTFIGAKNNLALQAASKQLSGKLSEKILSFQKELLEIAAILEAFVDFPEEGLEFASREDVISSLSSTLKKIKHLEETFEEGKKIHDGQTLCLIGTPNAGKSSLMNALLGQDRAIVTHLPGTTRDTLEADLNLIGLNFQLTDTAGIRNTDEIIEQEGIKRSKKAMEQADLILLLIDVSSPLAEEEELLIQTAPKEKTLLIWNKIDLPHTIPTIDTPHQVALSAKTGENIDGLKKALENIVWKGKLPAKDEVILTNIRHKEAITSAINDLTALIDGLQSDVSAEFLSSDMRSCLSHLSSIIGMDISEEILSSIFSKFCVGK